jgi:hypothetical protein
MRNWTVLRASLFPVPARAIAAALATVSIACLTSVLTPSVARADQFGPGANSYLTNANFVLVYWESTAANWNTDVTNGGFPGATKDRLDAFMQAVAHSSYFEGLSEYGVKSVHMVPSMVLGEACSSNGEIANYMAKIFQPFVTSAPGHLPVTVQRATTDYADSWLGSYSGSTDQVFGGSQVLDCLDSALSNQGIDWTNTVIVNLYPPQIQCSGDGFGSGQGSFHKYYEPSSGGGPFMMVPLSCNQNLPRTLDALTHDLVEAITDSDNGLGWTDTGLEWIDGNIYSFDEIADICQGPNHGVGESGPPGEPKDSNFLLGTMSGTQVANYWSNALGKCQNGTFDSFGDAPLGPEPETLQLTGDNHTMPWNPITLCGRGENMGATLSFLGLLGFWDLDPNATNTMYLNVRVQGSHNWTAGNLFRVPTPDTILFRNIFVGLQNCENEMYPCWSNTSIMIAGFDHDVPVAPGDLITYTVTDPSTGLFTELSESARAAAVLTVNVTPDPTSPPGWIMYKDATQVQAQVTDSCTFYYPQLNGQAPGPIEGDAVIGGTAPFGIVYDPSDYGFTVFPNAVSDPNGYVQWTLVTESAGQVLLDVNDAVGQPVNSPLDQQQVLNVHPLVTSVFPRPLPLYGGQITVQGAGFALPGQGPRTAVTVGGLYATNVVVALDGTSLTCTIPPMLPNSMDPIVVLVDGVPSLPLTASTCIPRTCGQSCQSAVPDGCGGTLDCLSNCTGIFTCTAPQGQSVGIMCCAPGQYIPAGGTSCECLSGQWVPALEECLVCPSGEGYCDALGGCATPTLCRRAGTGNGGIGCKPGTCG